MATGGAELAFHILITTHQDALKGSSSSRSRFRGCLVTSLNSVLNMGGNISVSLTA